MNKRFFHPHQSPLRRRRRSHLSSDSSLMTRLKEVHSENKQLRRTNAELEKQAADLRARLLALMPNPYFRPEDHRTDLLIIELAFSRTMLASLKHQNLDFPRLCAAEVHRRLQQPLDLPPPPPPPQTYKLNLRQFFPQIGLPVADSTT